jgi:predicted nucleic acid-binding protein
LIVLDASAVLDWLIQSSAGKRIEKRIYLHDETLHSPHLLDLEVTQVLRRLAREGTISDQRADTAVQDLLKVRIVRYPHFILLPRIWQYRHHLSPYDAAYVALAETLGAVLLTRDTRLARAGGHRTTIELF